MKSFETEKLKFWVNGADPKHSWERSRLDERGALFQLVDGEKFSHLVVIQCVPLPGAFRGRHFHLKKKEEFFLAYGSMTFAWYDLDSKEKGECELFPGNRLTIFPKLAHVFFAQNESVLVEFSSSPYDEQDSIPFDPRNPVDLQ
ncbi:hypothetical protein HYY75_06590 [bacterium]|nr:hypothetical protein [bacterium]